MAGLMTVVYRVRMDASNALAVGAVPATSTLRLPGGYVPRYVLATEPVTHRERKITVCDPTSALWLGTVSALTLEDYRTSPSAQVVHAVLSRVGEKRLNR